VNRITDLESKWSNNAHTASSGLDPAAVQEQQMRRAIVATAILASLAFTARASDGLELSLKNKALASAAAPSTKQSEAPFVAARDPLGQLLMLEEQDRRDARGGRCEAAASALCYDAAEGRIVYKSARKYMPQFEGLTAESVSVRSNRVTFKYSFR
jgi:hypothetical protein